MKIVPVINSGDLRFRRLMVAMAEAQYSERLPILQAMSASISLRQSQTY